MSEPLDPGDKSAGQPQYVPPVDPDGLQATSAGVTALGLAAATAGATMMESSLGFDVQALIAAGFAALGADVPVSLTIGLALIGLGLVLNVASLALRYRVRREARA